MTLTRGIRQFRDHFSYGVNNVRLDEVRETVQQFLSNPYARAMYSKM